MDTPYNGLPNRPSPTPTPSRMSTPSVSSTQGNTLTVTCCGRRFGRKNYQASKRNQFFISAYSENLDNVKSLVSLSKALKPCTKLCFVSSFMVIPNTAETQKL